MEVLADNRADEAPELVLRMSIVLGRRERGIARQAAEDEKACVGPVFNSTAKYVPALPLPPSPLSAAASATE